MKKTIICLMSLATLTGLSAPSFAAPPKVVFDLGAVVKHHGVIGSPDGKANVSFFAEGAGRMQVEGKTLHFSIACSGTDIYAGDKVADGMADCELKSSGAGTVYAHFQKVFDANGQWHQRGHFVFSGGTQDFATVTGAVPVYASVLKTGESGMAFFVEGGSEAL
ncbi:hypothetical protein N5D52_26270 [Pseudomonas sp. GD03860]|uniref:hypothetical protein n=1 Tax=Pseudomonas TaxID=286 RepID=UPI002363225A|nr:MULTISPECIES: hypothetical protein [Pseudomonas]MDD2058467.1 hypothetical protein [Pseudomonas putida]MDH0640432.1 hypothetical protein [Pseudomonas sp. GD03860]